MSDKKIPNQHPDFDNNVNNELGLYVYALFDPRCRRPFYVGKGGGQHGNDRVLHHFIEARNFKPNNSESGLAPEDKWKVRRIREIWDAGLEVDWKIIRRHLRSEDEAYHVEAALIDAFVACGYNLTNAQGGHGGARHGLIEGSRLYEHAAPSITGHDFPAALRNRPIFIFNIGKKVGDMWKDIDRIADPEKRPDYIAATTCCWKVGAHWRNLSDAAAIGIVGGISRAVFAINGWEKVGGNSSFWKIRPADLDKSTRDDILNRKFDAFLEHVKGYLQYGGFIVCEVSETGERTFRRGSRNRHPDAGPTEENQ